MELHLQSAAQAHQAFQSPKTGKLERNKLVMGNDGEIRLDVCFNPLKRGSSSEIEYDVYTLTEVECFNPLKRGSSSEINVY